MSKKYSDQENKKSHYHTVILIGVLLIIAILLAVFRSCESTPNSDKTEATAPGIVYDDGAVQGGWDEANTDKIIASLKEKVEEGMINISMNTSPNFKSGTSSGTLMIVNESINRYPQVIEITRNDTGEIIYKSDAIPVGSKIESDTLDTALPAGTYECTATFHNVDPETGVSLGCAGAIIHITVQE